jgi:hypothetical protein
MPMKVATLIRRAGSALNPPTHAYDPGPASFGRDWPVARRTTGSRSPRR